MGCSDDSLRPVQAVGLSVMPDKFNIVSELNETDFCNINLFIQYVPLATEPDISLIILPLMRILQRNLKRTYLTV